MRSGHALVLFSGGQDSTTCLAWALSQFAHVETIGFDYGQRHHVELQARHAVLEAMRSQFPQWSTLRSSIWSSPSLLLHCGNWLRMASSTAWRA